MIKMKLFILQTGSQRDVLFNDCGYNANMVIVTISVTTIFFSSFLILFKKPSSDYPDLPHPLMEKK